MLGGGEHGQVRLSFGPRPPTQGNLLVDNRDFQLSGLLGEDSTAGVTKAHLLVAKVSRWSRCVTYGACLDH